MSVEIRFYDRLDQVALNRSSLYLIFGFGTGDTFNAMVHLCKAPPVVEYELVIKSPQLNLVLFLLGIYPRRPVRIHVIDYWKHDFSTQLFSLFPSLPFVRGLEPNTSRVGFIDCWLNPYNYNKVIPLSDGDMASLQAYFGAVAPTLPLPDNAVILFPTAGANFSDYIPDWPRIVTTLQECGIKHVYANNSGVPDYGDEVIEGAEPISLTHQELIRAVYRPGTNLRLIAVRSGVMDILRFSGARALVFYQPVPEGIFQTCRFGLLRHNLDLIEAICLNESKSHQDSVIDYYLRQFIASPLER